MESWLLASVRAMARVVLTFPFKSSVPPVASTASAHSRAMAIGSLRLTATRRNHASAQAHGHTEPLLPQPWALNSDSSMFCQRLWSRNIGPWGAHARDSAESNCCTDTTCRPFQLAASEVNGARMADSTCAGALAAMDAASSPLIGVNTSRASQPSQPNVCASTNMCRCDAPIAH